MIGAWTFRALAVLGVIAGLAGCAATPPPAAVTDGRLPALTGTIVSARPVMLQVAGAEGGVLGALGAPRDADETLAPAIEFIVREAGGRIVSVIQPAPTVLHPGETVRILRGTVTRLAPLAPSAPEGQT
ncbi:hypothetical protein AiwAL_11420 [Acidiphilium sp. AL]|uniref:Lipoprotein n=1 Tax=Acidiphilium iwatense TaxID=768198 RepID=A0ABS9E1M0_9PROT|nr:MULTISPECIES: hypothetical protein [Acidiphilium]MCF3947474.1 hypothetical protein [Acidiphilium iwatense]MCU4160711.1 hypothetical protein [Acidiphilium sp. AL]